MTGFFRTVGEELKKAYEITKIEGHGYGGKSVSTITGKEYASRMSDYLLGKVKKKVKEAGTPMIYAGKKIIGGEKVSTLGRIVRDISYAVGITTGIPQFFAGVAVGAAGAELYEKNIGKTLEKMRRTSKRKIAEEYGKEAAKMLDEIYEQIKEINRKEKEFKKILRRLPSENSEEYEQFRKENQGKYNELVGVIKEFKKRYRAVANGKSFDMPVITKNPDGSYSVSTVPIKEVISEKLASIESAYIENMKRQQKVLDNLRAATSYEERQKNFDEFRRLEEEAEKLRKELEMTYAQLDAVEKRAKKKAKTFL